jgi:hypothetical protein
MASFMEENITVSHRSKQYHPLLRSNEGPGEAISARQTAGV